MDRETEEFLQHLRTAMSVKLNVGGVVYKTSVSTLRSQPNSMLAAMFSDLFELQPEEDGAYFIDRDGDLFRCKIILVSLCFLL